MRSTSFPGLVDSARVLHASSHLVEASSGAARAVTTAHPTPIRRHRDHRGSIVRPAPARRLNVPRRRSY